MKTILKINGMHCASCAATIEHTLIKEQGVTNFSVNYASEKALVEFNPAIISLAMLQQRIKKLGYSSEKLDEDIFNTTRREEKHVRKLRNTFLCSTLLALPILYLTMGHMIGLRMPSFLSFKTSFLIQTSFTTMIMLLNWDLYSSGLKKLWHRNPNMDSLIATGTLAAYLYSLSTVVLAWIQSTISVELNLYFESAALILVFISLGKYLEDITKGKTSAAIKQLIGLQPKEATVLRDGKELKIHISEVHVGDSIFIKPGEKIPVDGVVTHGYSAVDEKAITGESIPVEKKKDDQVIGGTINKTGILQFKATRVGKDTLLAQIIKIVEEAMSSKAPIQLLADTVSFYFVPAVFGIALFAFILWLIVGQTITFALTILVSVLIIACPCALGLATPTAVIMGTGLAAKNGILIKNGKALEIAHQVTMIVFDKTGTVTKGEPSVTDIIPVKKPHSAEMILQLAASVEKNSEHPLAQAIVNKAKEKSLVLNNVERFQAIPGKGVSAFLFSQEEFVSDGENKKILLGTRKLMADHHMSFTLLEEKMIALENQGKTAMFLAQGKDIIGIIAIADTLKDYAKETIAILHHIEKKVAMISGDNERVAKAIAQQLNINNVIAEVLPQEKSAAIKKLQEQGNIVAMVGDGINDAPALAQANVGIALGSGTDVAIETGEIVLIKDDLRDVIRAIDISSYTFKKIKQNLFWAFFYNLIGIPLAAGIVYPFTGWLLNPAIAAAAMAFSSVSVVLNALSMKNYKTKF